MNNLLKQAGYWKMAWLRVFLYGSITAWATFANGTEGFEALSQLTPMAKIKLFGGCAVAFAGVIVAFLDNTMSRLRGGPGTDDTDQPQPEQPKP